MLRHILIGLGSFLILIGILSFLVQPIPAWATLITLLCGAVSTVIGVWILQ